MESRGGKGKRFGSEDREKRSKEQLEIVKEAIKKTEENKKGIKRDLEKADMEMEEMESFAKRERMIQEGKAY